MSRGWDSPESVSPSNKYSDLIMYESQPRMGGQFRTQDLRGDGTGLEAEMRRGFRFDVSRQTGSRRDLEGGLRMKRGSNEHSIGRGEGKENEDK